MHYLFSMQRNAPLKTIFISTYNCVNRLAIFNEEEGRDAGHIPLLCNTAELVNVEFHENNMRVFLSQFLE